MAFVVIWVVGVGIFSYLLHYVHVAWANAFVLSIIPGLIWAVVGTALARKDEQIAAGRKAISETVYNFLQKNIIK